MHRGMQCAGGQRHAVCTEACSVRSGMRCETEADSVRQRQTGACSLQADRGMQCAQRHAGRTEACRVQAENRGGWRGHRASRLPAGPPGPRTGGRTPDSPPSAACETRGLGTLRGASTMRNQGFRHTAKPHCETRGSKQGIEAHCESRGPVHSPTRAHAHAHKHARAPPTHPHPHVCATRAHTPTRKSRQKPATQRRGERRRGPSWGTKGKAQGPWGGQVPLRAHVQARVAVHTCERSVAVRCGRTVYRGRSRGDSPLRGGGRQQVRAHERAHAFVYLLGYTKPHETARRCTPGVHTGEGHCVLRGAVPGWAHAHEHTLCIEGGGSLAGAAQPAALNPRP